MNLSFVSRNTLGGCVEIPNVIKERNFEEYKRLANANDY